MTPAFGAGNDDRTPAIDNIEHISEPGDVITEQITVISASGVRYDVSNFCTMNTLYEDIFSNVLYGEAMFDDSFNLIGKLAQGGNEFITISYRTPTFKEKITKSFYITKVWERHFSATDRKQTYIISYMSIEGFKDNNVVVSKKYSGTTDTVVAKLFTEYLATPRIIGTSNVTAAEANHARHASHTTVVVPSWSPLRAINWVAARSFTTTQSAPTFMFFESNKQFYYVSIEQLIRAQIESNNIFARYTYFPGAATIQENPQSNYQYTKPELVKQYSIVRNMLPFKTLDVLEGQDFGYYASRLFTLDMMSKQYKDFPFNYFTTHPQFKHLDFAPPFVAELGNSPDSRRALRIKHTSLHNDSKDPLFEKWALQRNSMLYELSSVVIEIEVPGRTDIEAGKVVEFLYPKSVDKTEGSISEDALDPHMSGLYLITAIRHHFVLNKHVMFVELVKDSYKVPLRG